MFKSCRHWLLFKTGQGLMGAKRWGGATQALGRAVDFRPDHVPSHNKLGIALLNLGRWEEAAAAFRRAIVLDPTVAEFHSSLAVALLKLARWDEAIAVCLRAIESYPDHASLQERLGMAFLKQARWSQAAEAFSRAIALEPEGADANALLGMSLMRLERWEEAVETLRRAVELDPSAANLHSDLGGALARLERWNEAAVAFSKSVSLDPDDPDGTGYANLADALARGEGSEERVATARRLVSRTPDGADAHLQLGIELAKLERWEEARSALQRGSSLARTGNVFQYLLVNPLLRLGRGEEALAALRSAAATAVRRPCVPGEPPSSWLERKRASFWSRDTLPARVFRVQDWFEGLAHPSASHPSQPHAGPRLLFLLDKDYGELTTLMYLVLGRSLYHEATLLLPDRLYKGNAEALPGRTHRYRSIDDVTRVVDQVQPDVVLLCSGYLLSIHRIFSLEELEQLIDMLRERGCRVVTADPFLGVLSKGDPRELVKIDVPDGVHDDPSMQELLEIKRVEEERLWAHFTASERLLRDSHHLYPTYCRASGSAPTRTDGRNISSFNAALVCPELVSSGTEHSSETGAARPHWFFVLSRTDYEAQLLLERGVDFLDLVAAKLVETLVSGRHPILVGPRDMIELLATRMPTTEGVDLLDFCPFPRFMSLLLSAEYAFYWNIVSHSILIRLFNKLPTIIFDRGHLVRNVQSMHERVVQWYYQGWEPDFLDHRVPLTPESLAAWTVPYRRNAERICEGYLRAPTPEEMIASVVDSDGRGASR